MPEFQSLATFKNALLAPLARVMPEMGLGPAAGSQVSTPLPATNATSIVTRHDHHSIEIKTVSELGDAPSLVETDIYLFVPRTFELSAVGKAELQKDFRSRMRLALPFSGEQGAAALETALQAITPHLARLETAERASNGQALELSHPLCEELLEASKDLCAVIAERLKHGAIEHTRQFFLSHKLFTTTDACTNGVRTLIGQLRSVRTMIERVRLTLTSDYPAPQAAFFIFDEYMSQLYVQYLGTIRHELSGIGTPPAADESPEYSTSRAQLETLLDQLQESEARHRVRFGGRRPDQESELDRERRLVRMSHLKKFFQSKSFVDISRQQSAKRISESSAAAGTAIAAMVAALIERFSQPEITNVAFQGLFVLCFGVIIYVLRDRMKDWMKSVFHEKALKFLPDFEQQLMAKERKIGTVKEWFRVMTPKDLPQDILSLRMNASATEMEKRLPEDVFHCRKIQEVHSAALASTGSPTRALHENTRVNIERHLKHMDDPFKDITDLDLSGRFMRSRSHRVYHFYLCVKTVAKPLDSALAAKLRGGSNIQCANAKIQTLVYRVVLDKQGVVRLEDLKN